MGYNYYYRADKLSVRREPCKRNIRVERAFGEEYSLENIKRRILENDYVRLEKIIPYKVISNKYFTTRDKIRRKYKPKGIVALYYYYKFLLGLYPKRNMQHNLTPEMKQAIKKLDKYSEQVRFVCKYKIETMSDIDNVKEKKQEEMQKILNMRNRLYYKRQKLDNESEKENITNQIIDVTAALTKVRKELKLCDEIEKTIPVIKNEIKEIKERENGKLNKKEEK